jgi:hypothetical protein
MALVKTSLVLRDGSTRWGLVTVLDSAGAITHQYAITAEEAEAVRGGTALPPGIDRATWETGRVMVTTRPCLAGDAVQNQNGELVVNAKIDSAIPDKLNVLLAKIPAGRWSLIGGEVWIEAADVPVIEII